MAPFTPFAALAALASVAVAQTCSGVNQRFQPRMGSGYKVSLLATGLQQPRHIVVDTAGNLLVAEGNSGTVQRLVLQEQGDIVCVASKSAVTTDRSTNHGISLSADGKTLFTSNLASVTAYNYDATTGKATDGKVIVTGMSNTGTHPTRAILVSKSDPDTIVVARGSNGNIDTSTTQTSSGRSMIRTFSISEGLTSVHQYTTGGELLGWGLRNIVGMGEDPLGGIWSVENSMDDVKLNGKDVHNENPAEKLNYHGILKEGASNKLKGANFGYPSCVPAWDTDLLGVANIKVGDLFKPDGTPAASDCASRQTGTVHFHSHTAPLDVKFNKNGTAAYIAFHGSWNRRPADGYRVMRVDFQDGKPVEPPTSKTAAIPVMENPSTSSCPGSCFRPVGLDFDAKGRLFVSSDSTGEVYVVYGA
ncbi:L-sorbosone dehydrogenase [Rhypophila decipiens]|uniref:L-sorbosone dehydrogenase n=1 Tax=Rhypophila decipiens TaxID=261697 RepID=A0AAN7B699_9PEZI|nr:L-sorbosone dehydrogenase [Rhypophila decipiens]